MCKGAESKNLFLSIINVTNQTFNFCNIVVKSIWKRRSLAAELSASEQRFQMSGLLFATGRDYINAALALRIFTAMYRPHGDHFWLGWR
ncbi:hypothetical protein KDH_37890 [Dictyobacter sp. S3.2.2.5]|uniref:Uncharacterized protein n=1 Tax=Dictyobacter halimunensis TaxID=3026934 RepID=A0ABQ6FTI4_9CHLR|nr:hypothetical protein KDH_37890 [Dictyobacter sp. S3.2.2.5]